MSKLCMIGTYHYDRDGEKRVQTALSDFRPDHVMIEGSESQINAQEIALDEYILALERRGVSEQIAELMLYPQERLHHEDRAAREYCKANDIGFSYFDDSFEGRGEDEIRKFTRFSIDRVLNRHRDDGVLAKDLLDILREHQKFILNLGLAFRVLGNTENEFVITDNLPNYNKNTDERDPVMFEALASHARENPEHKIATVTGTVHIFKDKNRNSLYCRAKDAGMEPIRKIPVLGVE